VRCHKGFDDVITEALSPRSQLPQLKDESSEVNMEKDESIKSVQDELLAMTEAFTRATAKTAELEHELAEQQKQYNQVLNAMEAQAEIADANAISYLQEQIDAAQRVRASRHS